MALTSPKASIAVAAVASMGLASDPFANSGQADEVAPQPAEQTAMITELPYLAAMRRNAAHQAEGTRLGWCDIQAEFEFTLDLGLDGIEREHTRLHSGRSADTVVRQ